MSSYGMEEKSVLQEVKDWYKTGNNQSVNNAWTPCKTARHVSDEPCLQKLFEYWNPGIKREDEKEKQEIERKKKKKRRQRKKESREKEREEVRFLEKEAAKQRKQCEAIRDRLETDKIFAENVLNILRSKHTKRAEQSETGLFHIEETHEGASFHLMYDTHIWCLFTQQHTKYNNIVYFMLQTIQDLAIQAKTPTLSPLPVGDDDFYLFAGIKWPSQRVFSGLLAAVTISGESVTRDLHLVQMLKRSEREHSNSSIQPKMRNGAGHKENTIQKQCLA